MPEESKDEAYKESMAGDEPFTVRVEIRDMPVGTNVRLRNGAIAEVTANPADGGWLFVRYIENEDSSMVGTDDMVFCVDVIGVV